MPKLHDVCQVMSEEVLAALVRFAPELRQQAFEVAWEAIVSTLQENRDDAPIIIRHLQAVMCRVLEDSAQAGSLSLPSRARNNPELSDFYAQLQYRCHELVRQLFP